jgi:predicted small lipoprotein YifL
MRRRPFKRLLVLVLMAGTTIVGCGKKGPPLAPLRIVPAAPGNLTAVRMASEVSLRFTVPSDNVAGAPGPVVIDRVEIYAVSLAPGATPPPNRDFLDPRYLVGTVPIQPAPVAGAPEPPAPATPDTRPAAGETARFVEVLTPEKLSPAPPTKPAAPVVAFTRGQIPSVPVIANPLVPKHPVRIYAARGVTSRGVAGNPSARVQVPLVSAPAPPDAVTASFTATSVVLKWAAPEQEPRAQVQFNVYKADAPEGPALTAKPVAVPTFERPGVEFGVEECFVVRTVETVAGVAIESEASPGPACTTPRDVFPPAAPAGLNVVSSAGVVALIWDQNTEQDLAGYLVLRAEAPGETLRPITPAPITDAAYRDTAVTPGVRYVYAIVAVDRSTPANISAQSARVEVTAAQ